MSVLSLFHCQECNPISKEVFGAPLILIYILKIILSNHAFRCNSVAEEMNRWTESW